jgi:hypothetical protein
VPSARRPRQLALLALCGALGAGSLAGCETTQEKASAQRAESERILKARAKRQARHKDHSNYADGAKSSPRQKHEKGEG